MWKHGTVIVFATVTIWNYFISFCSDRRAALTLRSTQCYTEHAHPSVLKTAYGFTLSFNPPWKHFPQWICVCNNETEVRNKTFYHRCESHSMVTTHKAGAGHDKTAVPCMNVTTIQISTAEIKDHTPLHRNVYTLPVSGITASLVLPRDQFHQVTQRHLLDALVYIIPLL